MNLMDVNREFNTEEACLEHLEATRWPDGVRCPTCGAKEISRITRKPTAKNKRTRSFQCLEKTCRQQFTATHGTMFYRSHIPLPVWFAAIAFVLDAKKGMSAMQLQRHLGIGSYETAWYLVHRIRKSMEEVYSSKLTGVVEIDETWVGGKYRGKDGMKKGQSNKEIVVGMRERQGDLRLFHVQDVQAGTLGTLIKKNVSRDVEGVMTDEHGAYPKAFIKARIHGSKHETVNHSKGEFVRGNAYTNTIESEFGLFKRAIIGSWHHISAKHLHRYLTEHAYRRNCRKDPDKFGKTLRAMLDADTMPYRELISSVSSAR
jgi:transposase-like protein